MREPRWSRWALVLAAALLAAGVAGLAQERPIPPRPTPSETPQAAVPQEVPAEARSMRNPVPADAASVENGRLIWSSQCAMCHGATGNGKGPLVARLGYVVPDFTSAAYQKTRADGELFWILSQGHGKMKGQGERLEESTRWNLVNFIRTLPGG